MTVRPKGIGSPSNAGVFTTSTQKIPTADVQSDPLVAQPRR